MTRTAIGDTLSALAAATLVSAAGGPALAQGKSDKALQAEVAMDAVRGVKPTAPKLATPRQTANGQDCRWFQDYGAGSK